MYFLALTRLNETYSLCNLSQFSNYHNDEHSNMQIEYQNIKNVTKSCSIETIGMTIQKKYV